MRRFRLFVVCTLSLAVIAFAATAEAGKKHKAPRNSVLIPPPVPTYGFSTPAPYPYGWFGTEYRTRKYDQHGFYGDYRQTSVWRGYF